MGKNAKKGETTTPAATEAKDKKNNVSAKSKDIKKEEEKKEVAKTEPKKDQIQQKINFEAKTQLIKKPQGQWDYFALDEKYKNL